MQLFLFSYYDGNTNIITIMATPWPSLQLHHQQQQLNPPKKKLYLLFNQNNNNKSSITIVVETTASITTTTTFLQLLPGETAWIREETHSIYNLDILLHSTKNKSTMMSSTDLPLTPKMIHDNCEGWLKVFYNNTTVIEPMKKLFCAERKMMHIFATMAWARNSIY